MRHHCAVRHSDEKDRVGVDVTLLDEVVDQCREETDVVDALALSNVAIDLAPIVPVTADSLRIDDQEVILCGKLVELSEGQRDCVVVVA